MFCHDVCQDFTAVLRIREILERIRIRGSVLLTNGSGSGFCYFVIDVQDANKRLFSSKFSRLLLFKGIFTSFFKIKKSQNSRNQGCFTIFA